MPNEIISRRRLGSLTFITRELSMPFGKVNFRRADEHAAWLHCYYWLVPLSGLHGREKNSGCHHSLLPDGLMAALFRL